MPAYDAEQTPAMSERYAYKAFISYKHVTSGRFAAQLESALKRYAKPRLARPFKIFRDEKHLAPGPDLPRLIASALDASEYLILLASPEAAASPWVQAELDRWCGILGRTERLILVLVGGEIGLGENQRVNWHETTALPQALARYLDAIPLYVDMRMLVSADKLTLEDPTFKRGVNGISARLRQIDPNEMLGEEILQYRRNLHLRNGAIGALGVLTIASAIGAYSAVRNAAEAQRERSNAVQSEGSAKRERNSALVRESQLLAAESVRLREQGRFTEAIDRALDAFPNYGENEPRPYAAEAEAALATATLDTPLCRALHYADIERPGRCPRRNSAAPCGITRDGRLPAQAERRPHAKLN
jgi:TIR domain